GGRKHAVMAEPVHGYQVPIQRGVWDRIIVFGAPRFYARAWACLWLFVGLLLLTYWGFRWLPLPFLGWLVGHGVLFLLTQWNPNWEDMLVVQLIHLYNYLYISGTLWMLYAFTFRVCS